MNTNALNANLNRTYNPNGPSNALSNIKRLLTSRDTVAQNKACNYLLGAINRYQHSSFERTKVIEYLLANDITVFLCEATSNLDFSLFKTITSCFQQLWSNRTFFAEEHASQCMTSVLRCLAHYSNSGSYGAVENCLQFLCNLLTGTRAHEATPPLSRQCAYSAEQLLACMSAISAKINNRRTTILSGALVLQALVSYQPPGLDLRGCTGKLLAEVVKQWFCLLIGALNYSVLMGERDEMVGMFYAVVSKLGIDVLRLIKIMREGKQENDIIQNILADEQEVATLVESAAEMTKSINKIIGELVMFTKDNQRDLSNEEYAEFLKLLLTYFMENPCDNTGDFCDMLFTNGYLTMLPQVQIMRNNISIRKVSTIVLSEILKVLAQKHLDVTCSELCDSEFSTFLIYAYFYCQCSESPLDATANILPFLIEHILLMPCENKPPDYFIKALWLVFAVSTVSNSSLKSLEERIHLEKATERLASMIQPDPRVYYTHHPAVMMWVFSSQRIITSVRICILSLWLEREENLPMEMSEQPAVWRLLLRILVQHQPKQTLFHTLKALNTCLEAGSEEDRQDFAVTLWSMLPNVLSRSSIDCEFGQATNLVYLIDLCTSLIPVNVDDMLCLNMAVLISAMFTKTRGEKTDDQYHFEYVSLKLSLYLLVLSHRQNDNRVLITYVNRAGFLSTVLQCTESFEPRVARTAAQLLSYIIMYYTKSGLQPKSVLELESTSVVKTLRDDSKSERGASIMQLVYMVLNCGPNSPLVLSEEAQFEGTQRYWGIRSLMFRVQHICCMESSSQSAAGWKTLSSIFNHAISTMKDAKLVEILTLQPWIHTLLHIQLKELISEEFLTFVNNWLKLYNIALKNMKQKGMEVIVLKESPLYKTLFLLRKHLVPSENDPLWEAKKRLVCTAKQISDEGGCRFSQNFSQNY